MVFEKINNKSVVQTVIDRLTEAIIKRELNPGDKLPPEQELADSMGVARNSIREAIKILVNCGVFEIRRPEGTFVRNGFSDTLIDPMVYGIILNQDDSFEKLMDLREMIEAGILRLAVKKKTPESLKLVESRLEDLKKAIETTPYDPDKVFECDTLFHVEILHLIDNIMVDKINAVVQMLIKSVRYETTSRMMREGQGQKLYEDHKQIYEIIKTGNTAELNELLRESYHIE